MTFQRKSPHTARFIAIGLLAAGLCANTLALEMPKRKSGLWDINTSMDGMPKGMGAIQHCIDQNSDNLLQQGADKAKQQCSAMDIKQSGNKITVHSVCKMDTTTTTMDAVFTGAFESAYRADIKTRFNPPMHGMAESKMTIEAKWLGACKPGQKPGDVVMPGGGTVNLDEMMKKKP